MHNLTELEVENLRHLIGGHGLIVKKLETYAQNCSDPELKTIFERDAQAAKQAEQQLMSFLG
ncbi:MULTISPECIES: hypothetical protein [Sporosarcina]|uniref:Spore coat protein n=2 Tax=Sporosarcina TaxID=1569 RepID=A0A380CC01_SPOPA|nr:MULTISPECIES: hypothetical protein [Sporosarcina]AOV06783.1 hypothetical protein BI350_03730 [Sporosarcina ureilytica]MDS9473129.1 hypothetical protein [Sporosarcina pasteurii]QBQ04222.1 hypothetical protein E2C16_00115 [Sporosarcina pasteurii]SUJ17281.1 Uncharacterised protein [Sporosarcina pasteurii]